MNDKNRGEFHFQSMASHAMFYRMNRLWTIAFHLALLVTGMLTLWAQSLLGNIDFLIQLTLIFSWFALFVVWIGRWVYKNWKQPRRTGPSLAFPGAVLCLMVCDSFHLPIHLIWQFDRPVFENALKQPSLPRTRADQAPRAGRNVILQSSRQGKATRFVLQRTDFIFGGTTSGYAYCPTRCERVKFIPYWYFKENSAKYIALGQNWYAWTQEGTDSD